VQDELDGLGQTPGGWIADGNTAGVVSAVVLPMPTAVTVTIGQGVDPVRAQQTLANLIYQTQYGWGVGDSMSYVQLATKIDAAVAEVLDITFSQPPQFTTSPPTPFGGPVGSKIMPSTTVVTIVQA
jgi:hypothetical protein